MTRAVIVEPYNPEWRLIYEKEAAKLYAALQPYSAVLHHIGSTSVSGLAAKPTIDILIELEKLDVADEREMILEKLGYEARGENGIKGRRYFVKKDGDVHLIHVHMYENETHDVLRHIAFRDYLIANPEMVAFYSQLKTDLATAFPQDIESYIAGKDEAVKRIEAEALNWWYAQ